MKVRNFTKDEGEIKMTLATFLDILFFISLFKVKLTKSKLVTASVLIGILKLCFGLILKPPFYIIPDILTSVLVLHFMLRLSLQMNPNPVLNIKRLRIRCTGKGGKMIWVTE